MNFIASLFLVSRECCIPMDSRSSVRSPLISEKSAHQIFLLFLMKPWLYEQKKVSVLLFSRKFKIGRFCAKKVPNHFFFASFLKWRIRIFWFFWWSLVFIKVKKLTFHFFVENSKFAFFGQKWPKFCHFFAKNLLF